MYECCNYVSTSEEIVPIDVTPIYIHNNKPATLHLYCYDFAKGDKEIQMKG